ncbi:MAG TPA: DHHA1 domain-containing protein, partial [Pseudomonadota bacterium]|nr:DHHA1 domain-containing protein [Pseudomonadota bacterium]
EILALQKKLASASSAGLYSEEKDIGGLHVVARRVEVADGKALRELAESLVSDGKIHVIALGSAEGDKVSLVVAVAKAHTGKVQAGKLVSVLAAQVGGRGGGKPEVAQAGGTDASKLDDALRSLFTHVSAAP